MNPLIETLNRCGENALHFAWPMLWQSSVLIAVLFAFDFALRRHVRAAVRYALWLVLLVKLLLPPSLALPTGAAWWLFPSVTPPAKKQTTKFVVNYGPETSLSLPAQPAPVFVPPPQPSMSVAAWAIPAWGSISLGLFTWLIVRWQQVARVIRRATPAPDWLGELFDEAKFSTGLRLAVHLRLTDQSMSPAVCGLFRPVILLPQSLAQKLSPTQLRAVLLHELTHLRRRDVWINCTQALAQIVYWWHPLLWFANARIRRVREEAVDDAVMLALCDEAETYAPTLLEVARLEFHRPLASLGLVGILESRSALRQRIERLVNFHTPRKSGLTLVSLCGIFIFSAAALPMGEATISADKQPVAQTAQSEQSLTVKVNSEVFIKNVNAQTGMSLRNSTNDYTDILLDILSGEGVDCSPPHGLAFNTKTGEITTQNTPETLDVFRQVIEQLNRPDGQCSLYTIPIHRQGVLIQGEFYRMQSADFDNLTKGLHQYDNPRFTKLPWWSVEPDQFAAFSERVKSLGLDPIQRPRIQTSHGILAQLYCGNETNFIDLECLPFVTLNQTQPFTKLNVRVNTKGWFTDNPAGDWPVHDGTNCYAVFGQVSAEDHGGIVLRAKNPAGDNLVVILNVQIVTNDAPALKPASGVNTTLLVRGEGRNNITAKLDRIQFSGRDSEQAQLETRTFNVDKDAILPGLQKQTGLQTNIPTALNQLLSNVGVELSPPKFIDFNETRGLLYVRATPKDLDAVEKAIMVLMSTPVSPLLPPQIHIKARFIEVPEEMAKGLGTNFAPAGATNVVGILSDPDFRLVLHTLEQNKATETLAEPEVLTLSGRQTQMRVTDVITIITNFVFQETPTNSWIAPQQSQVEVGPVLDVVPSVLPDRHTIDLRLIASLTEFLGYDQPKTNSTPVTTSKGEIVRVPTILPKLDIRQALTHVQIWDNQTVVLNGGVSTQVHVTKDKVPVLGSIPLAGRLFRSESRTTTKNSLLVFVTATLIDPAGNRMYADEKTPAFRVGIPAQNSP